MDTTLRDHRLALRGWLNANEFPTPVDTLLEGASLVLTRLTGGRRPVSFWYSAAFISLLILVAGSGTSLVLGERSQLRQGVLAVEFVAVALSFSSLVIFRAAARWVLTVLSHDVLKAMTRTEDIADLQRWGWWLARRGLPLVLSAGYGLGLGVYAAIILSRSGFVGFGPTVTFVLVGAIWGIPIYELFVFLVLPSRLGRYEYHLFTPDPGSSKVIDRLSRLFTGLVLLYAVVAAGSLLFLAYVGVLREFSLVSVIVAWLPIVLLFAGGQYALAGLIARAKARALSAVQAHIERLQAGEGLLEKDRLESIGRLWDYHDRIKSTRNSALDFGAVLNFVNSLLLPLISFLLGVL